MPNQCNAYEPALNLQKEKLQAALVPQSRLPMRHEVLVFHVTVCYKGITVSTG